MSTSGMTQREIRSANAETEKLARDYKPVGQTDMLHMVRNARSVVGSYTEAVDMMRPLLDLRVISQHTRPHASAEEINTDFDQLVKSAELAGVTSNHKKFERYIEGIAKAMNVFGDTIRPHQFMEAAQYGRAATMGWSPEFVAGILPTMIQHHGGSQAGTAAASFYSSIVGGKMSNLAVNQLNKLGLLDDSKVIRTKTGNIKGVDPGGIKGSDTARTDPNKWVWDYYGPALKRAGITSASAIAETTSRVFSNRVAAQFVTELMTQRVLFEKDAALTHGAKGRDAAREIMDRDLDQAKNGLVNAVNSLAAALGAPFMPSSVSRTNSAASWILRAAQYANNDTPTAVLGAAGAAGASVGMLSIMGRLGLGMLGVGAAGIAAPAAATGIGLAGLGALWLGAKGYQKLQRAGEEAGINYNVTDATKLAGLRRERDALEAEIAGVRPTRPFANGGFNPVIDYRKDRITALNARIASSEQRIFENSLGNVAPGLLAFGQMPANRITGAGRLQTWSKPGTMGRSVSYDEAMHPGGRSDATRPNLAPAASKGRREREGRAHAHRDHQHCRCRHAASRGS